MKRFFYFTLAIFALIFVVSCGDTGKTIHHGSDTDTVDDSDTVDPVTDNDSDTPYDPDTDTDTDNDSDAVDTDPTDDNEIIDDSDSIGGDTDNDPADPSCQTLAFDKIQSTLEDGIYAYVEDLENPGYALFWLDILFQEFDPETQYFTNKTDLYDLKGKTIVLGEGSNANYSTCTECVILYGKTDDFGYPSKTYFAKSGSLEIEDVIAGTNYSKGTGSFTLYEITIDEETDVSTYVENGECFAVSGFAWDNVTNPPECFEDSDCGEDEECVDGTCRPYGEEYCEENSDCGEDGLCIENSCAFIDR